MAIHFANELHLYIQTSMIFICKIIERQHTNAESEGSVSCVFYFCCYHNLNH